MKKFNNIIRMNLRSACLSAALLAMASASLPAAAAAIEGGIKTSACKVTHSGDQLIVSADFMLDSLRLGANHQIYITPVLADDHGHSIALPAVLLSGRNMHYAIERKTIKAEDANHPRVAQEVRRNNGRPQTVAYLAQVPFERWMLDRTAEVSFPLDECGCGAPQGKGLLPGMPLALNPAGDMIVAYITPQVTELPVAIHDGKARIQFEVDRTELHPEPYRCKNGQRIDNRAELKVIGDSLQYALSDPNVEIAELNICGYASPESPYLHNEELATGRSRALSEYIADRYNLPAGVSHYSSVPENWEEFRQLVVEADDITEQQRSDLLDLIDAPAYGAADYDRKEKALKTEPRFAQLYKTKILPEWFPKLRATKFAIKTRLKPMSDQKLAEVILTSPEKMSLNQMFRVANLYPEGSDDFNRTIGIALRYYADDPVANLNAAVAALREANEPDVAQAREEQLLAEAERYLAKAGDTPEAENARGLLAAKRGDLDAARSHFMSAGSLPEAMRNLQLLR